NWAPTAVTFSSKSGGSKKLSQKKNSAFMDPIQKLFLNSIHEYTTKTRLYGGGDLTSFPEFKFTEAKLDEEWSCSISDSIYIY
uniref:ATP synthase peripheral stalk subunit F6, mitochondrial n=1 Tax=Monopterus albus TaxID=43700 RepID=A0A3Q3JQR5_MONAL